MVEQLTAGRERRSLRVSQRWPRAAAIARRIGMAVPTLLGVTLLTFLLIHLVPGDPARTLLGNRATPEAVAGLRDRWGLNDPLPVQYGEYLVRLLHADLGTSLFYNKPVVSVIGSFVSATAWLVVVSCVLAVVISVPLAVVAAVYRDRAGDQAVRFFTQLGLGMPSPWVGLLLILAFALNLRLFPAGGFGTDFPEQLRAMILPGLTVALGISPILIRSLRAEMLEVLTSDYVTTARSKGLRESRVLTRHALRNASIATITILGLNVAWLVSGAVVVERVFALPGLGTLLIDSILRRDFPVVQGLAVFFALGVIGVTLLTDLTRSFLDPRVGLG